MSKDKIKTLAEMQDIASNLRAHKQSIVFTNGCFDILHAGHVVYLEQAKALGSVLIIGVNSDESIRRIKGNRRPIVPEAERCLVLAALECVDYITIFGEETPLELIKLIKPDLLVKGGDWQVDRIVGSDYVISYGGKALSLPFQEGLSTSAIIERILGIAGVVTRG
jgi:D-glycero-beta-D-manno-heptose 1-phosphate adenylyltransferase